MNCRITTACIRLMSIGENFPNVTSSVSSVNRISEEIYAQLLFGDSYEFLENLVGEGLS
jgi:hypothetical protein